MKKKNNLAYLLLILTTFFWSGNFIVGKVASIYEIPPFSLNFYRWFFACLILMPFTIKELIKKKQYIFKNIGFFIILGITSITIFNSIVYYSLYYTQVISGVLMISTIPVWIIFISSLLNIEKTNIFQILGVILSLTGVLFIITKADINLVKNLEFNKGDLTMIIAMFSCSTHCLLIAKLLNSALIPISSRELLLSIKILSSEEKNTLGQLKFIDVCLFSIKLLHPKRGKNIRNINICFMNIVFVII